MMRLVVLSVLVTLATAGVIPYYAPAPYYPYHALRVYPVVAPYHISPVYLDGVYDKLGADQENLNAEAKQIGSGTGTADLAGVPGTSYAKFNGQYIYRASDVETPLAPEPVAPTEE